MTTLTCRRVGTALRSKIWAFVGTTIMTVSVIIPCYMYSDISCHRRNLSIGCFRIHIKLIDTY